MVLVQRRAGDAGTVTSNAKMELVEGQAAKSNTLPAESVRTFSAEGPMNPVKPSEGPVIVETSVGVVPVMLMRDTA